MAKPDPSRDYYADLELKAGADINDIKRQFKKLALKYHPDRNPGRELEFNSKFQAIQAAHEILTDPDLKLKYDIDRARHYRPYRTPMQHSQPVPMSQRNPFNPSEAWDPPRPHSPLYKAYTSAPSDRASQYATYGKGFGKGRSTAQDDTEAKLRAWKNMRNRAGGYKPPPPPTPPEPPKRPESQASNFGRSRTSYARSKPQANPFGQPSTPLYTEHSFGRTKSARTPRRSGFAPGDDGGDEPAAPNTSAYASYFKRHASSPNLKPESPEPALPPRNPDPLAHYKSQFMPPSTDSPRVSTPYATAGGEKTYFSSSKLGRSKSTRVSPTPRPTDPMDEGLGSGSAKHIPKMSKSKIYAMYAELSGLPPRRRGEWQPGVDSDNDEDHINDDDHIDRSSFPTTHQSHNKPTCEPLLQTMYKDDLERRARTLHNRKDSPSRHSARRVPHPENGFANSSHNPMPGPGNSVPPNNPVEEDIKNAAPTRPFWPGLSSWEKENSTRADYDRVFGKHDESLNGNQNEARGENSEKKPNIFTFELGNDTPISPPTDPKLPGPRNIDTRFSPTNWTTNFFGADTGPPQQAQQSKGSRAGGRKSPVRSNQKRTTEPYLAPLGNDTTKNIPPMPPPKIPIPTASPGAVKFEQEYWAQTFKEPSWIPPPHPPPSTATGANIRSKVIPRPGGLKHKLSSKTAPRRVGPHARNKRIGIDTESDSSSSSSNDKSEVSIQHDESNLDSGPMDVDSPAPSEPANLAPAVPPRPTYNHDQQNGMGGARTVPLTPTQSEWVNLPSSTANETTPKASAKSAEGPPVLPPRGNHTIPSPSVKSATLPKVDVNANINFDDLQRVEPLAPSNNGLRNLGELSASLPFESRAASHVPGEELQPQRLALPKVPRAPAIPYPPFPLTTIAWEQYLGRTETYMNEWNNFNHMMLAHFNSRQLEVTGKMTPGWLGIVGEGPAGGFGKYMKGIEEDFRVRQHWNVAWEKHRVTMKEFGQVREKIILVADKSRISA